MSASPATSFTISIIYFKNTFKTRYIANKEDEIKNNIKYTKNFEKRVKYLGQFNKRIWFPFSKIIPKYQRIKAGEYINPWIDTKNTEGINFPELFIFYFRELAQRKELT